MTPRPRQTHEMGMLVDAHERTWTGRGHDPIIMVWNVHDTLPGLPQSHRAGLS